MKIALLMKDQHLKELLTDHAEQAGQQQLHFFEDPNLFMKAWRDEAWEYAVLSDRFFHSGALAEFIEWMNELEGSKSVQKLLMLSNWHNRVQNERLVKYCLANGYSYIGPGHGSTAIARQIARRLYGDRYAERDEKGKIILFLGTTPNIGTSLVSFGTAVQIARQTDQTVAYVCLNLKSSKIHRYIGIDEPTATLDGIRAELKSKSLTKEQLRHCCDKVKDIPNLHVLYGNMLREQAEFYMPDDIEFLIGLASASFDLCIVEVNAYWDNAATVCGIMQADSKVVVTTNELGHFQEDLQRWLKNISAVFGMDPASFDIFVTQHDKGTAAANFRMKDVRRETGMNVIGVMKRHAHVAPYLNQGKIVELVSATALSGDLNGISNLFISLYGMTRKQKKQRKQSWFKRLVPGTTSI